MAKRKPWYETLFERDYFDYYYVGGPTAMFTDEQRAAIANAQLEFIARALELPEGARVFDLCCGWGRHTVRLAQRGYRVTGLDLSRYHLRLAKAEAKRAGVEVSLLHGDMREIPRSAGRFDAVINMFTSFGYFDDEADNQRVLDGVARALKPGGRFLIDTMNLTGLMRVFRDSDCEKRLDGSYTANLRRYDIHRGRSEVEMLYFGPDGERREQFHSVRLYSYPELEAMLSKAGLGVERTWGDFDGSDLSRESRRMIVLAQRGPRVPSALLRAGAGRGSRRRR